MLEQRPPVNVVTMGIDYDQSLKASLDFEYDGVRVTSQDPLNHQDVSVILFFLIPCIILLIQTDYHFHYY